MLLHERGPFCFYFRIFVFILIVVCCAAVRGCVFASFGPGAYEYRHRAYRNKKISSTLPGVCTYVRHPRYEAYVAPELASEMFFPEAWRQDSWHYQAAGLQLRSKFNRGPLFA